MNNNSSLFRRISSKIFKFLNTTRKIIINIVFFSLVSVLFIAITSNESDIVVPAKAALVLNISGDIVEQKREVDPMNAFLNEALNNDDKRPEVLLSDVIDVINKAKDDVRISILVLQLQNLNQAGLTKLRDIAKALGNFKASGKKIIAMGEQFTQDQYYLASFANDIWLDPKGWMILDGYGRYQMYFKSALDKLEISQHIFRVGTYKSAVEPYMRDDMSAEAKAANKVWLNDLWGQYKIDVAAQRGFGIENFDEDIDTLINKFESANSNFAQYALDNQWVDQLKTQAEMRSDLIELVGKNDSGESYNHISFKNYLSTITSPYPIIDPSSDKVAIIVAKGTILNGHQKAGTIGGASTSKLLRQARENNKVKAVVLRVDSPGGSAYASEVIRREIDLLKASGKPVVVSMGTYAASGGYWISAPADKIFASPTTITGSIGIYGLMMTFENSLKKLGVSTDGVSTTDIAGFGPTRPLSSGMSKLFQLNVERGYQDFITLVAKNRDMTLAQVDAIAQGRVWSGLKAKELGLVDELGDITDAIIAAAQLAELDIYDTLLIEKESSAKDKLLQNLLGSTSQLLSLTNESEAVISKDHLTQFITVMNNKLNALKQFNDPQGIYVLCMACEIN
ncbi:MAG: signal peptide peptidase SppA [Alteromonadaceae bacterium]|tara:strand:+ start:3730 stop:5601 length:1872 start_codon:yes stop_codon:yes gene_type:complete